MKQIAVLFLLLAAVLSANADESIPKWCKGEKIMYSLDEMSSKGFTPCGELKALKVCDASGNRYIGHVSEKGVFKDCSIGPRIKITRHDPLPETYNKFEDIGSNFAYNETDSSEVSPDSINPVKKVEVLKTATDSYVDKYGAYMKALDSMIDTGKMPEGIEKQFIQSKDNLRKATEAFPQY